MNFVLRVVSTCVLAAPIWAAPLRAADIREAAATPLTAKIAVDGALTEPQWQGGADVGEFVQVEPRSGDAPTEATRVWVAYSKDALYVAVRCFDRNSRQIVATEMKRDATLESNDNVEIMLDTYHDHRNAYYFATNATGALVDGRITENRSPAMEWDGIWNVRTRIDDHGWTAEFEIPFKTIGFNPSLKSWGFNISRYLARARETSRWASPSLDVKLYQAVRAGEITGLEGLSQGVGLDVKPYGIAGFTRDVESADRLKAVRNAGADVFYRITSNLVSSTTFNTDFAETEADSRQVNLTRFPLFFPEKRSFFLEDAGIFEFAKAGVEDGGSNDESADLLPFFSRRIGMVSGAEVPLRVGEKLTGKIGRFDVGVLDVQTGSLTEDSGTRLPSKNLAVARVKANFGSQSYIGAMFTNGDPTAMASNQVGGLDLKLATSNLLQSEKNLALTLFGTKTRTTGVEGRDAAYGGVLAFPNDLVSAEYKWMKIGENYNPALGFVPRKGVRISSAKAQLSPRPKRYGVRQLSFEFAYSDFYNLKQQASETNEIGVTPFQLKFNNGYEVGYEWTHSRERLFEPWDITDGVILPVGQYSFAMNKARFKTPDNKPLFVDNDFLWGSFFSGTRREFKTEATWRMNRHLTTALTVDQNWIHLKEGSFNTTLVMYRLDYSFTPFITLANFVQYDTESQNIGLQSRLRWILKPGNEVFVVFNHGWQENQFDRFEAAQTRFRVKLNYTFRF